MSILQNHGVCLQGVSPLPDEPELELVYSEPSTSKEAYTVNKLKVNKKNQSKIFVILYSDILLFRWILLN